ncbi:PilZ domain-containing protein [Polyangium jinanense]|nr:PilZ domain-containing protein [Polyangium jinanense]
MERRIGPRAQCDYPLVAIVDGHRHACRAVDLSVSGLVFERPRALVDRELSMTTAFELDVGAGRPIRLRGRPIWSKDRLQAIRFVSMNDADRLTLAEQLDRKKILGDPLH